MDKKNDVSCEIIRDLLPMYVEEICSQDSQKLVEEHLEKCEECRSFAQRMKTVELEVQESEPKELDYMKKVKRHIQRKDLVSFGSLVFVMLLMLLTRICYTAVPFWVYFVMLPVLARVYYLVFSEYVVSCEWNGWKKGTAAIGFALLLYTIALVLLAIRWVQKGEYPFNIGPEKLGPFVDNQLLIIILLQISNGAVAIYKSVKTGVSNTLAQVVSLTGICMGLSLGAWLHMLDTMEGAISTRNSIIIVMLLEGIVLAVIFHAMDKRKADGQVKMDNGKHCV